MISTQPLITDRIGAWKVRWGIGRMHYLVPAGLYAIGRPAPEDPVLVTANYKMSYDLVRQALHGRNAWLLVLETFGINVWCAAGKGTFGTEELVRRLSLTQLSQVVTHRQLILPILGAPGVAAHKVARQTGFSVKYAAIRAADIPAFLDNGQTSTGAMRSLTFTTRERLVLVPVELVLAMKSVGIIAGVVLLMGTMLGNLWVGVTAFAAYFGAVLSGTLLAPLLLPWLPGRSFSIKGALAGAAWSGVFYYSVGGTGWSMWVTGAVFLALPAVSAFFTLNYTGCTPFTSISGVKKEMRVAIPTMGIALLISACLLLLDRFM